jgi:hypothetical protein
MLRLPLLQVLSWWETEIETEVVRRSCSIKLVCGGSIRADLGDLSPPCGRGDEQEDDQASSISSNPRREQVACTE